MDGLKETTQEMDIQEAKARWGSTPKPLTESELIDDLFDYHSVGSNQIVRMQAVRDAAKNFCRVLLHSVPACSDRGAAVEGIRLAAMMANHAISRDGRPVIK